MAEHVNLAQIIRFLESCGAYFKYENFAKTFEKKINTDCYFILILESAIKLSGRQD